MNKQIKPTSQKLSTRVYSYWWAALIFIMLVATSFFMYSYYLPQKLAYTTSQTVTTLATPRSVVVNTSGRYATIYYFSGPSIFGGANVTLPGKPSLSTHGSKVLKLSLALQYGDSASGRRNTEFSIKLTAPLSPGRYEVKLTESQNVGLSAGRPSSQTLTANFKLK